MELNISNGDYSLLLRSFTALAFVPEQKVVDYFRLLSGNVSEDAPPSVVEFVEYMADTYAGRQVYETIKSNEN